MTNFDKLARWDADYYNSLSDDDCVVCLTEKQVYLIGQIIEQLTWAKTRWTGDIDGLDLDKVSSELNYRISERMTCEQITLMATTVNNLQETILSMQQVINQVFNQVDGGDDIFIFEPETSTVGDVHTTQELSDLGVSTPTCTSTDKDAVYGAVSALVRYINQVNIDLLERINQAGNFPDQLARLISAIPVLGLLPVDEVFSWVQFIATELEDEYNATVDEALLQSVICDLFCIAVGNDCHLDFNDVYNYFAGKTSPTLSHFTTTLLNLINFALTGTFAGDDYFYYFFYFQIVTVGMGQFFFGINSMNDYAFQARAGLNSPDNDWSIFCLDCPEFMRKYEYDFALGLPDGAILDTGTLTGSGIEGVDTGADKGLQIRIPAQTSWRLRGIEVYVHREGSANAPTHDVMAFRRNTTVGVPTSPVGSFSGGVGDGDIINCRYFNPADTVAAVEYMIVCGVSGDLVTDVIRLEKLVLYFTPDEYPLGAIAMELEDICV